MEYDLKGAALGGTGQVNINAKQYAGNAIKQSEGQEILSRLSSVAGQLSETLALASGVSGRLLGPRPEAIAQSADKLVAAPHGFLSELRAVLERLEAMPGSINSHLNRIDQSF